jgi:hypothetical protein
MRFIKADALILVWGFDGIQVFKSHYHWNEKNKGFVRDSLHYKSLRGGYRTAMQSRPKQKKPVAVWFQAG